MFIYNQSMDMFTQNNFESCIFFFRKKSIDDKSLKSWLTQVAYLPFICSFSSTRFYIREAVTLIGIIYHPIFPGKSATVLIYVLLIISPTAHEDSVDLYDIMIYMYMYIQDVLYLILPVIDDCT